MTVDGPDSVVFALSPLSEEFLSLHVLLYPKTHALQHPWIREMKRLSTSLRRGVREFAFLYFDAIPDFIIPAAGGPSQSFLEQLAQVERMPVDRFAYEAARPIFHYREADAGGPERLADPVVRGRAIEFASRHAPESGALTELLFDDPAELQRRLVAFLRAYWDESFAETWERLEPRLVAAMEAAAAQIAADGVLRFLERQTELRVLRNEALVIRASPHEHEVAIGPENRLLLVPSAYVWPHVRANCDPPWPPAIVFSPIRPPRYAAPDELVRRLRAAGDPTRLNALKLIAKRPRSTEELAPLVGLSEAGLSKHLKRLVEAGLVEQRRDGYYVLYALDRDRIASLADDLAAFLDGDERSAPDY